MQKFSEKIKKKDISSYNMFKAMSRGFVDSKQTGKSRAQIELIDSDAGYFLTYKALVHLYKKILESRKPSAYINLDIARTAWIRNLIHENQKSFNFFRKF